MSLEEEAHDKMASLPTAVSAIMLNVSGLYPLIKKQRFFPLGERKYCPAICCFQETDSKYQDAGGREENEEGAVLVRITRQPRSWH